MNNKYIFTAIAVVVVLIIALFIYNNNQKNSNNNVSDSNQSTSNVNTETNDTTSDANANTSANSNTNTQASQSQPVPETNKPDGNDVAVTEVTYNGTTFSPATVTVKQGDVVVFKNAGTTAFWPASDPHPTHTDYPEFDAKTAIPAGQTYQFKFDKVGTWGYHNHMNHTATGTVIVK